MKTRATIFSICALGLLLAGIAHAASYVMIDDLALYDQAPAIAQVSVISVGSAPAQGVPSIDYIVLVERLLKGKISGSTVVVRVAGGVGPDGWGLELPGAPKFAEGDRAILFLVPQRDGTYGILHLMLGAFHEFTSGGHHLALRDLDDGVDLVRTAEGDEEVAMPRDFERFADWLAAGAATAGSYRVGVAPQRLERWQRAFAALRHDRNRLRWFDGGVEWHLARPAPAGARRLLKDALRAWNPVAGSRLTYGGRTDADAGLGTFDGTNVVAFGDADQVIPGTFSCRHGGVAAVGGPWFDPEVTGKQHPGAGSTAAIRILGADIMVNDGADCLLSGLEGLARETLMHELGHTLGLGFSCGDSLNGRCDEAGQRSVMRAVLRADGATRTPGPSEHQRLDDGR